ncbi:FKBP-type peptidyl-prolyl cis-trans isomerase SlpA [hydrothermal vent metagenome]|jgi:FKBP-type peptidyl-prolyl cis-trans isomerase SlpA|uniref:peptidylprolyl isomerase n=1 Tax=hydrothermal vent metagenome TaxID=652676 RepID=A0A160TUX2_9ZZZZ|tara:strand:+ start:2693 stop:3151 length:459 start_codon:yes stop_codon:yes gene_type:complete
MRGLNTIVTGNETVLFHYQVLLADGRVIESSGADPESVCLGEGALPVRLEATFAGRHLGEAYHINIDAEDQVFGVADDDNTIIFPLSEFPAGVEPVVGALFEFDLPHGGVSAGRVIRIEGPEVLMDFNHPLIGKNVRYEIKIVAVEASSKDA